MQKITIIGNLTRDPETRTVSGQYGDNQVCSFNVAVNSRRRSQNQNGQQQDEATFYRVSVWGRQADVCQRYLAKGRRVAVVGELQPPRIYTDVNGVNRVSLEIRADDFEFLTSRAEAEAMGQTTNSYAASPAAPAAPTAQNNGFTAVESDDLPF